MAVAGVTDPAVADVAPSARSRWTRRALYAATMVTWAAIARLAIAFVTSDLSLRLVAEHSRRTAPWPYRLAGLWGSAEGSLLLFAGVVAAVASIAARRMTGRQAAVALGTVTAFAAVVVLFTDPFERLAIPAVDGFGLTPILEHPAMAVHPPLLYAGLAMALPAALVAFDDDHRRNAIDARRWLLGSVTTLTSAMALGGLWSYVEQGWGGYWAWDPVENTSLAPWLAALVALHTSRWSHAIVAVPWLLVLFGSALARSGSAPSVHAFADSAAIGWSLLGVALVTAIALAVSRRSPARPPTGTLGWRLAPVVLLGAVLAMVVAFTAAPSALQLVGRPPGRVAGDNFSRFTAVVAAAMLVALVALAVRARRRVPGSAWVAHVGFVVLLAGVAGSSFDRTATGTVAPGAATTIAGLDVSGDGVDVRDGPRPEARAVVALLDVGGQRVEPALVAHADRGGVLSETALISRPWRDVQVVLLRALDDGRALIEVRVKPLVQLVWIGAALIVIGSLLSLVRRPWAGDGPASARAAR